jgi:hypothetical protein
MSPITLLVTAILISSLACQSKQESAGQKKNDSEKAAASAEPTGAALVNPAIADAVQEAARAAAQGGGQATGPEPPPNGILGGSRANEEAKVGSRPKVTLGGAGSEPRVQLGGSLPAASRPGQIEVAVRTGPRAALPTVEFLLTVSVSEATERPSPELKFAFNTARLGRSQPGQIPESAAKAITQLQGSEVSFGLNLTTAVGGGNVTRAKAASEELDILLQATADLLGGALLAYPPSPVGKDAVWMATSRETFLGADVVAYRLYRVTEVGPAEAVLEINTKRYLAGGHLGLAGLDQHEVLQFSGTDETQLKVLVGQWLPVEGRQFQRLNAVVGAVDDPEQQAPVQIEARSVFAFPSQPGATASDAPGAATSATAAGAPPAQAPAAVSPPAPAAPRAPQPAVPKAAPAAPATP